MRWEADRRITPKGWDNASVIAGNAQLLTRDELPETPAHLHIFLGMSVFSNPAQAFNTLWGLLAPGGRCVIADVHSPKVGFQGHMVSWTAGADIRRELWAPLEAVSPNFQRTERPSNSHCGDASGLRCDAAGQTFCLGHEAPSIQLAKCQALLLLVEPDRGLVRHGLLACGVFTRTGLVGQRSRLV